MIFLGLVDREWLWLASACYLVGFLLGTAYLLRDRRQSPVASYAVIAAGFLLQTLGLYLRGRAVQGCPIGNMFEIFQFTAWSAISLYLLIGAAFRLSLLGYFTSCLSAVLTLVSLAVPAWDATKPINAFGNVAWVEFHAALALFSYGVFALLALTSAMYLLQTYSLKYKHLHGLFSFLPSILELDLISVRLLVAGVILMTWSLGIGSYYWLQDLSSVDTAKLLTAARLAGLPGGHGAAPEPPAAFPAPGLGLRGPVRRRPALPRTGQRQPPSGDAPGPSPRLEDVSDPAPTLFLLGASHHTAPLELREKLALTGEKLDAFHGDLRSLAGLQEYAVLNTCNRVEIYGVAARPEAIGASKHPFARATRWTRRFLRSSASSCTVARRSSTSSKSPRASTRRWSAKPKSWAR